MGKSYPTPIRPLTDCTGPRHSFGPFTELKNKIRIQIFSLNLVPDLQFSYEDKLMFDIGLIRSPSMEVYSFYRTKFYMVGNKLLSTTTITGEGVLS